MENIIISVFSQPSEAYQALSGLKTFDQSQTKLAQATLVEKVNGQIQVKDGVDFVNSIGEESIKGSLIGSLVGILGGPLGILLGYGIGGSIGANVGVGQELSEASLIATVSDKLFDGETALISLAEESDEQVLDGYFGQFETEILRWDVATVAAELDEAIKLQAELANQARAQLKAQKKSEREEKFQAFVDDTKTKLDAWGKKLTGQDTDQA